MEYTYRYDLINKVIKKFGFKKYLEIGVCVPSDCFDMIEVEDKVGVDPGIENPENPVARYNLAIMYKKVEKTKEARQELEMLRSKLEPGTRFYYTVEEHLENLEARKQ